jgi:hypothetical protein
MADKKRYTLPSPKFLEIMSDFLGRNICVCNYQGAQDPDGQFVQLHQLASEMQIPQNFQDFPTGYHQVITAVMRNMNLTLDGAKQFLRASYGILEPGAEALLVQDRNVANWKPKREGLNIHVLFNVNHFERLYAWPNLAPVRQELRQARHRMALMQAYGTAFVRDPSLLRNKPADVQTEPQIWAWLLGAQPEAPESIANSLYSKHINQFDKFWGAYQNRLMQISDTSTDMDFLQLFYNLQRNPKDVMLQTSLLGYLDDTPELGKFFK